MVLTGAVSLYFGGRAFHPKEFGGKPKLSPVSKSTSNLLSRFRRSSSVYGFD